jgi:hypothetical protein
MKPLVVQSFLAVRLPGLHGGIRLEEVAKD